MKTNCALLFLLCLVLSLGSSEAKGLDVSFARGKWKAEDFTVVKGPRWPYVLSFEQLDDAIVNPCPDVPGIEIYKKHHGEVYAAMVHKERFDFGCTISSNFTT